MKRFLLILMIVAAPAGLAGSPLGSYLDRIDLSGYLRLRVWNIAGRTHVPDKLPSLPTYRTINYIDLNLRNRINLSVIPEIEVRTVFESRDRGGQRPRLRQLERGVRQSFAGQEDGGHGESVPMHSAEPLSVGQLQVGMKVHILHVSKSIIPLSASVLDPSVYPVCERAMGIELARYALEGTDADR